MQSHYNKTLSPPSPPWRQYCWGSRPGYGGVPQNAETRLIGSELSLFATKRESAAGQAIGEVGAVMRCHTMCQPPGLLAIGRLGGNLCLRFGCLAAVARGRVNCHGDERAAVIWPRRLAKLRPGERYACAKNVAAGS